MHRVDFVLYYSLGGIVTDLMYRDFEEKIYISIDTETASLLLQWKRFDISMDELRRFSFRFVALAEQRPSRQIIVDASVASGRFSEDVLGYTQKRLLPGLQTLGIEHMGVVIPFEQRSQHELNRLDAIRDDGFHVRHFYIHAEARKWLKALSYEATPSF